MTKTNKLIVSIHPANRLIGQSSVNKIVSAYTAVKCLNAAIGDIRASISYDGRRTVGSAPTASEQSRKITAIAVRMVFEGPAIPIALLLC